MRASKSDRASLRLAAGERTRRNVEIQQRAAAGESIETLASEHGLSWMYVRTIIMKRASQVRRVPSTPPVPTKKAASARVLALKREVAERRVGGESYGTIAQAMQISTSYVSVICRDAGLAGRRDVSTISA